VAMSRRWVVMPVMEAFPSHSENEDDRGAQLPRE
jgi:hypothetical protein